MPFWLGVTSWDMVNTFQTTAFRLSVIMVITYVKTFPIPLPELLKWLSFSSINHIKVHIFLLFPSVTWSFNICHISLVLLPLIFTQTEHLKTLKKCFTFRYLYDIMITWFDLLLDFTGLLGALATTDCVIHIMSWQQLKFIRCL